MTDVFIPPAPERPDHRRAAIEDAIIQIEARLASSGAYYDRKRAEGTDRDGIQHAMGVVTGLVAARKTLRDMMQARTHA